MKPVASLWRRHWIIAVLGSMAFHVGILFVPLGVSEQTAQSAPMFDVTLSIAEPVAPRVSPRVSVPPPASAAPRAPSRVLSVTPPSATEIDGPVIGMPELAQPASVEVAPAISYPLVQDELQAPPSTLPLLSAVSPPSDLPEVSQPVSTDVPDTRAPAAQPSAKPASPESFYPQSENVRTDAAANAPPKQYFSNSAIFEPLPVTHQHATRKTLDQAVSLDANAADMSIAESATSPRGQEYAEIKQGLEDTRLEMNARRALNPPSPRLGRLEETASSMVSTMREVLDAPRLEAETVSGPWRDVPAEREDPTIATAPLLPVDPLPQQTSLQPEAPIAAAALEVTAAPEPAAPEPAAPSPAHLAAAPEEQTLAVPETTSVAPIYDSEETLIARVFAKLTAQKRYPAAALRRKTEGTVTLLLSVEKDGSLASVAVQFRSGSAILDEAALSLVRGIFPIDIALAAPVNLVAPIEYRIPK